MKLGSTLLNSERVKPQLLNRLHCVDVVDSAAYSEKKGVEGKGGSPKDGAGAPPSCCPCAALS